MKKSFAEIPEDHTEPSDESFGILRGRKIPPGDMVNPVPIWERIREAVFIYCQFFMQLYYGKNCANRNENPQRLIPIKIACKASVWLGTQNRSIGL